MKNTISTISAIGKLIIIAVLTLILSLSTPTMVLAAVPGEDAHSGTMSVEADGESVEEKQADEIYYEEIKKKEAPEINAEDVADEEGDVVAELPEAEDSELATANHSLTIVSALASGLAVVLIIVLAIRKKRK